MIIHSLMENLLTTKRNDEFFLSPFHYVQIFMCDLPLTESFREQEKRYIANHI